MNSTLLIDHQGPLLCLTLNRPQSRNALNRELLEQLIKIFNELIDDPTKTDLVILKGAGGHFCAGGDIGEMSSAIRAVHRNESTLEPIHQLNCLYGELLSLAESMPQTLVTVIEGVAMGGGMGLVCVADYTIAHHQSRFALPEARLGLVPAQVAPWVVKRVGLSATRRLALCGGHFSAEESLKVGLVHDVFDTDLERDQLLKKVTHGVSALAPQARIGTKRLLLSLKENDHPIDYITHAADEFVLAINKPEFIEGSRALREHRSPQWLERWRTLDEEKT